MYDSISMVLSVHLNQLMNNCVIWYDHSLNGGCFTLVLPININYLGTNNKKKQLDYLLGTYSLIST